MKSLSCRCAEARTMLVALPRKDVKMTKPISKATTEKTRSASVTAWMLFGAGVY